MQSASLCFSKVKNDCVRFITSQETSTDKFKNKEKMIKSFLIPICFWIAKKANKKKPYFVGLAGGQGTGNTQGDYAGGGGGASCAGHPGRDQVGSGSGGAGIRNNWRTGSAQYYAGGGGTGNGGSGAITFNTQHADNSTADYHGNITQTHQHSIGPVSYTHLTLPTIYSV